MSKRRPGERSNAPGAGRPAKEDDMRQGTSKRCALEQGGLCQCDALDPSRVLEPYQERWILRGAHIYRVCRNVLEGWTINWLCHICGADVSAQGKAHLDHDHATGKARGVLCASCNMGLIGLDRPAWLHRAIAYLQQTSYDQKVRLASTTSYQALLPPPVANRRCLATRPDGGECAAHAMRFVTEVQVCRHHAGDDLRALHIERQRQWAIIAEGTFWSLQRLWREKNSVPPDERSLAAPLAEGLGIADDVAEALDEEPVVVEMAPPPPPEPREVKLRIYTFNP